MLEVMKGHALQHQFLNDPCRSVFLKVGDITPLWLMLNALPAGYEYIVPGNRTRVKPISVVLPTT